MKFMNPVLRGMYPDPSMCAAGGKYYMVCSSFCYFPGVPLFESDDMINWRQIGHCLTRRSQLPLEDAGTAGGIYAPTIRYNNGRFYMVVTNVSGPGNFYVWTDDIYGEWSEPVTVGQSGIDPSLFFDDDGRVYFISNGNDPEGRGYIQISEIDISTGRKLSDNEPLWYGTGGRYIEAPHLYKIGGWYYLLDAEGGTEYGHMVNYARSGNLRGPFEPCPDNPVLTNRNLGGYQLQGAGHGDLLQASDGTWWFCHLAFRQIDRYMPFHHLGRETCMEPVSWKDGWFYIGTKSSDMFTGQGYGNALMETECPEGHGFAPQNFSYRKTFSTLSPELDWNFLRNPHPENYEFCADYIRIRATSVRPSDLHDSPSWTGIRQNEFDCVTVCDVRLDGGSCSEAGISVFMDGSHHYDLYAASEGGEFSVSARVSVGPAVSVLRKVPVAGGSVRLKIVSEPHSYTFILVSDDGETVLGSADSRYLSSEVACGFTGVYIALYAYSRDGDGASAEFSGFSTAHGDHSL